ncbi:MAG TPA: hypothetical protein VLJ11_08055 [Bryobacteraceae bacterium]|nr:hypothetical protein [Bryobacteraceae bacterium]
MTQLRREIAVSDGALPGLNLREMPGLKQVSSRALITLSVIAFISAILYAVLQVNVPFSLQPGAPHDDGLFIQHARGIAAGKWLGPYSQYTLMKGVGYPLFLAAVSFLRLPVPLVQALFFTFSVYLLSLVTLYVFQSGVFSILLFETVLWNFGPETERILREGIYGSQFLVSFSFLILALLCNGWRRNLFMALSGVFLGWMWITREEGATLLPAFLLLLLYFGYTNYRSSRLLQSLVAPFGLFLLSFALVPTIVSEVNFHQYHTFSTVDIKGDFEGALEALASIHTEKNVPYLVVSKESREIAYKISPTFARLRKLFDDPGSPYITAWKPFGCQFSQRTCGDYAYGWFVWAFRDAAFIDGDYASAPVAAAFYRRVHDEVEHACEARTISCDHSLIPFMPKMGVQELRAVPKSLNAFFRKLIFKDPPSIDAGPSFGSNEQVQSAAAFLNVYNYIPPPGARQSVPDTGIVALAMHAKGSVIKMYARFLRILIVAGWLAFLFCWGACVWNRTCAAGAIIACAAWIAIITRLALLELIDVSSFSANTDEYMSFVFPLSCFASLVSLRMFVSLGSGVNWTRLLAHFTHARDNSVQELCRLTEKERLNESERSTSIVLANPREIQSPRRFDIR